jgi:hypothetical protein
MLANYSQHQRRTKNGILDFWNCSFGFANCFCWNSTNGNFVFDVGERKDTEGIRKKLTAFLT